MQLSRHGGAQRAPQLREFSGTLHVRDALKTPNLPAGAAVKTEPVRKTQGIRLLDVIVIGPAMMGAAWELRASSPALAMLLGITGLGTVLYNWANLLEQERRDAAQVRRVPSHLDSAQLVAALRSEINRSP